MHGEDRQGKNQQIQMAKSHEVWKAVNDMWESPVNIIMGEMQTQIEGDIYKAIQNVGIDVDKEELLKALQYDRQQYEKGYADAIDEFAEKLKEFIEEDMIPRARTEEVYRALTELQDYNIDELAEQMKGGE